MAIQHLGPILKPNPISNTAALTSSHSYALSGVWSAIGFAPQGVRADGTHVFRGWGLEGYSPRPRSTATSIAFPFKLTEEAFNASKPLTKEWALARLPQNKLALGMNAFFMAQGYRENGLTGAYDAFMYSAAFEASQYHWATGIGAGRIGDQWIPPNMKLAGMPLKTPSLLRGLGAGIGGAIGQGLGGATGIPGLSTLGAFAGAYIGGNPFGAIKAHPMVVGGILAATTVATVGYGAYHVVKGIAQEGYAYRQSLRGINTDGSMAAFMTQNALTMRERAVQAISKSHLNARSALGQEASFMHTNKNYNSMYR